MQDQFTRREIGLKLLEVAKLFNEKARDNTLFHSFGGCIFEINMILKKCGGRGRILDLGGGMGVNLSCLRRLSQALELYLIDRFEEYTEENPMGPSETGLRLLEELNIFVVKQDFWENPKLPYNSEFFDVVTCFEVIEHLPGHPLKLFKEIHRVLKKEGTFICGVPNSISLVHRIQLLLGRHPYIPFDLWCKDNYYSHYREYSQKECRKLLEMSNFNQLETFMVEEPSRTSARNRYLNGKKYGVSLVPVILYIIWLLELAAPSLRHRVYCVAKK